MNETYRGELLKPSKLKELVCIIFGHSWDERSSRTDKESGIVLEHSEKCGHCGLEIRDQSGYLVKVKLANHKKEGV